MLFLLLVALLFSHVYLFYLHISAVLQYLKIGLVWKTTNLRLNHRIQMCHVFYTWRSLSSPLNTTWYFSLSGWPQRCWLLCLRILESWWEWSCLCIRWPNQNWDNHKHVQRRQVPESGRKAKDIYHSGKVSEFNGVDSDPCHLLVIAKSFFPEIVFT